uniref:16S rRNA (guanine(1207)-N(2))-methyltransferase RsmC n=1 Tax=Thaumasiovibrio occultus TaxID=1891184 RepID=UPI000B357730|nr:16S rRNA (guanine(1207)-N(2))-methyltransferase RsmC [Thaumasiovibrio occultus]
MSLSAPSEVVARQAEYSQDRHVLVLGEWDGLLPSELLSSAASVKVFTTNYLHYQQLQNRYPTEFAASISSEFLDGVDQVLLYWPKSKAEAEYLLAMSVGQLPKGTEVCIVGENRGGVRSADKMMAKYGTVTKRDSARRCSFYWGMTDAEPRQFELSTWFKQYPLSLGGVDLTVYSLPGVFSHGEFDLGTQLLLNNLPELNGKILDFGCGAGLIGAWMKARFSDIDVTLVDISALAIESARQTLRQNGLDGTVKASNIYSDIDVKFDAIVSNPPFHAGLKTSYSATETLLEQAPVNLTETGQLVIVANRFLQYPPIIETGFGHCNTLASGQGFNIYFAQKV